MGTGLRARTRPLRQSGHEELEDLNPPMSMKEGDSHVPVLTEMLYIIVNIEKMHIAIFEVKTVALGQTSSKLLWGVRTAGNSSPASGAHLRRVKQWLASWS